MKNKMKKRVVKILTLVFCMVAVVTTTILPTLAAFNENAYDATAEDNYPVTQLVFEKDMGRNLGAYLASYSNFAYGENVSVDIEWDIDTICTECSCCDTNHESIEYYNTHFNRSDGKFWGDADSWNLSIDDYEIRFEYFYNGNGLEVEDYPMQDTDVDGYYYVMVRIYWDEVEEGIMTEFYHEGLGWSNDGGGYHVFSEGGTLPYNTLLKVEHWSTSNDGLNVTAIKNLETYGILSASHPRYEYLAGASGYNDGYGDGYDDGHEIGYDEGYDDGYEDARIEFEPGTDTGAEDQYQNGYDDGYSAGYDTGYAEGTADSAGSSAAGIEQGVKQSKFQAYQAFQILKGENPDDLTNLDALFAKEWAAIVGEHVDYGFIKGKDQGYGEGYYDGNKEAGGYSSAFKDVAFAIFEAPVNLVNGMLDFDLFGINVASLCKTLITVSVVAAIVTVLVKFVL